METACKLCNAMDQLHLDCTCGATLQDQGPAADYQGPYSPYYNETFEAGSCHHLFTCPRCGRDTVIAVAVEPPDQPGPIIYTCVTEP